MKRKILLFDIDGTLIRTDGCGGGAMAEAFLECFGIQEATKDISFAGLTDWLIYNQIVETKGQPQLINNRKSYESVMSCYCKILSQKIAEFKSAKLLNGVRPLLEELKAREDIILALLTGNLEKAAKIKLVHFNAWDFFEFGAYGDEAETRPALYKVALNKFSTLYNEEVTAENFVIIGDTPKDIEVGKYNNLKTVAVASGTFNSEELAKHQPDLLFKDFSNFKEVTQKIITL